MLGLGGSETNIKAVITADDRASGVLKGFGDNVSSFGGVVEKGLKTAAVALAAAGAAAAAFGVTSVKAFTESQDLIAQTNAVLKSTGNIAGVTADEVTKLATALQKQTKFSDEDVRSVENLLLTFTAVGKDIFPQATKTVLDMAQALGEDTKSASIQLGKALQDPILGVTALRRVGVNFNSAQQEVIKNLVETGQSAKAQQLILKELNTEFGGSAEAAGNTFSGSLQKLKNSFNDVQEAVGKTITQSLQPLVGAAADALASIDWAKVIDKSVNALKSFSRWLKQVATDIYNVYKQVAEYLGPKLEALWNTLNDKIIPVLKRLWKEVIEPLIPVIGTILVGAFGLLVDIVNAFLAAITPVINFMLDHKQVVIDLAVAFGTLALVMKFDDIKTSFLGNMSAIMEKIGGVKGSVTDLFTKISGGTAMGGIAVAGALADIALVAQAVQSVMGAINAMNNTAKAAEADAAGQQAAIQSVIANYKSGKISKAEEIRILNFIALPQHAAGTNFAPGGLSLVGEEGPELVNLPRGSRVTPAQATRQALQGNSSSNGPVNVVVNVGLYAGSEQEKRKVAMELLKSLQDLASSRSTTVGQMLGVA